MDDFPHLAEARISNENAAVTEELIEKVKDKVVETTKEILPHKESDETNETLTQEGEIGEDHFQVKKLPEISKNITQPLESLFEAFKKKGEEVQEYYKDDVNELVTNLKKDANFSMDSLNTGINKLSLGFSNTFGQKPKEETRGTEETTTSTQTSSNSFFSSFTSFAKSSGLSNYTEKLKLPTGVTEYAEKISKSTGIGEYAEKLTENVSTFLKQAVVIEAPDEIRDQETKMIFDRKFAKLIKLQSSSTTYIEDPSTSDKKEAFEAFINGFDFNNLQEQNKELLKENSEMLRIFERIVPTSIDEETFWKRYYFNVHMLEQEEIERKKLIRDTIDNNDVELYNWDESDGEDEKKDEKDEKVKEETPEISKKSEDELKETNEISNEKPTIKPVKQDESYELIDESGKNTPIETTKAIERPDDKSDDDDWGTWE
ncbi:hypothetical protein K502DRAFT_340061 [Neoconidiobolus thromboides FSU 785]|nr:hypothetical protein K502DRAFT_340061 [Neoconidiobolus thromboides FSU 785]